MIAIGHRGAAGYEPENTLRSIRKALELDVPWIEIDVYFVDGRLIVFHDDELDRTTNGTGSVQEQTFAYLRTLDAGKGEQIPTLEEVLDTVDHKAGVNIELKGKATAEPVVEVIRHYIQNKGWTYDSFLVSSFDHPQILEAKRLDPAVRIGVLIDARPIFRATIAEKMDAYSINLDRRFVTRRLVKDAHRRGLKVFVYTVNEINDFQRMIAIGVDGVFSDYPDRVPLDSEPSKS
jgi:glycerophosphoryl diester phosphodiesterase